MAESDVKTTARRQTAGQFPLQPPARVPPSPPWNTSAPRDLTKGENKGWFPVLLLKAPTTPLFPKPPPKGTFQKPSVWFIESTGLKEQFPSSAQVLLGNSTYQQQCIGGVSVTCCWCLYWCFWILNSQRKYRLLQCIEFYQRPGNSVSLLPYHRLIYTLRY